ncbi:hypothetical protein AAX26_00196 [Aliarcobacter thereius]|uniref:Uncharacterized protein n=2 Tax=Aliarcobacter thereius TaxID=544718 RepID=A0A1C0B9S9_9BACT|nr:hypothetical protein [Aliarcobacter thereius]OCL88515.1 hypothetical protein AAX26_00196 [Aliarcobacter thereius]OCL92005.1 hypothetical protein AAX25_00730 [Aliarcobacter thereius]OCL94897.1 hypothetical protein AA347_00343 [Aliarcobacter thereius LMG 24486]OCM00345.1 hypothetical protein AAX29_00348 [Aliarcobacter thereius]QBF15231.1 putative membrane protein [Aliarcobacter thereius LMG 24486]
MREKSILTMILDFVYSKSKQPVLLKDLLVASIQHSNGLEADSTRLGFRLKLTRAYFVYIALVLSFLVPLSLLTHKPLANIDPHISILGAMIITALIFMGFNYFIDFLKTSMTKQSIQKAWSLHFPYFSYKEYSSKINSIFQQALKEEVPKRDLQKYILDRVSTL